MLITSARAKRLPSVDFLNAERQRILAAATPERRAQMEAAEESRAVYRAWNAVCARARARGGM